MLKSQTVKSIWLVMALVIAASAQQPTEVPATEAAQHLIKRVEPQYPPLAKAARLQGNVTLKAVISKGGTVADIKKIDGHPILMRSAIDAVKQWRYRGFIVNGKPTEVTILIEIPFSLGISEADAKKEEEISQSYFQQEDRCRLHLQARQYAEAEKVCRGAIDTVEQLPTRRHMERITAYQYAGHALLGQKKSSEAWAMYEHELKLAKAHLQPDEAELGYAYRDVAVASHGGGNFEAARTNYELAESTLEQAREHIDSVFLKNKYSQTLQFILRRHAVLFRETGDFKAADALDKKANAIVVRTDLKD